MKIVIELGDEVSPQAFKQVQQVAQACADRQVDFNGDDITVQRGDFTCICAGEGHPNASALFSLVSRIADENQDFETDSDGRTLVPLASGEVVAIARPGRKPLAEGEGKTARVQLKLTPADKAEWLRKAEAAGLTLQAWVELRCSGKR